MTFYSVSPVRFGVGVSGYTATLGVNDPELGTRCVVDENEYLFVYNNSTAHITAGSPAGLSGVTGYSVCATFITALDAAIGVRLHSTLPTNYYGWICTKGVGVINMGANESCVTGTLLQLGVGGFAAKTNSTNYQSPTHAKALESIASGGSGAAFFSIF